MTAMMRQIRKQILTLLVLGLAAAAGTVAPAGAAGLVTRIVADPLTGVAIEGYDPVTYFTEPAPLPGSPDHFYEWGGVPWYFVSAANRDAFMRAPDIYAPQFGGHCTMSLARGYLSDGRPGLYAVEGMRLYLFYSTANREAFLASPARAMARAEANWQAFAPGLSGPAPPPVPAPAPDP